MSEGSPILSLTYCPGVEERVFGNPLAEDGMTGAPIDMALAALRPIHVHIRMDFLMLTMNLWVDVAAKSRSMYGGRVSVALVVRSMIGKSWDQGAQHSQGLYSFFVNLPGLKVVAPATPYDAKGTLIAAIRDGLPSRLSPQTALQEGVYRSMEHKTELMRRFLSLLSAARSSARRITWPFWRVVASDKVLAFEDAKNLLEALRR